MGGDLDVQATLSLAFQDFLSFLIREFPAQWVPWSHPRLLKKFLCAEANNLESLASSEGGETQEDIIFPSQMAQVGRSGLQPWTTNIQSLNPEFCFPDESYSDHSPYALI